MSRIQQFRSPTVAIGLEVVPSTLMVALGHPWLGAATICLVLGASVLQLRMLVRSEQQREQAMLTYAQLADGVGAIPAPVIGALHGMERAEARPPSVQPAHARPYAPDETPWAWPPLWS